MIIGIGGVSRSGKSRLSKKIRSLYPEKKIIIFDQDDFVVPTEKIPRIDQEIDWECPESMDFDRFRDVLIKARGQFDIVIGEGILVFYQKDIYQLFDRKIMLSIDLETFRKRKLKDQRWGFFPDWYVDHIWNSYLKYGTLQDNMEDVLYLSGMGSFNSQKIQAYLALED